MRTAPFTNWHTQIVYADKSNDLFCGVKCLMAFIIEPEKYSGSRRPDEKSRFFARDYYTQKWHDMKTMTFVLGSDVLGPMGKDLVPFSDEKSAQTFLEDHRGEAMLEFEQITPELIRRLRQKKGKDL